MRMAFSRLKRISYQLGSEADGISMRMGYEI